MQILLLRQDHVLYDAKKDATNIGTIATLIDTIEHFLKFGHIPTVLCSTSYIVDKEFNFVIILSCARLFYITNKTNEMYNGVLLSAFFVQLADWKS